MQVVVTEGRLGFEEDELVPAAAAAHELWRFEAALPLGVGDRITLPNGEVVQVVGTAAETETVDDQGLVVVRQYVVVGDLA
ncbi:MAG: hypothetical protein WCD35_16010 [Mycobacteriales bacterium]